MDLFKGWIEINEAIKRSPLTGGKRVKVNIVSMDTSYKEHVAEVQEADMLGTYKPTTLLSSAAAALWQSDVDVLDGSINHDVRINPDEDAEVKRLYHIWKSL